MLDNSQPKYLNSPETPLFSKSATLYGINLAASAIRAADAAVIVEGYLDVIISHQYGFTNTVASMGTAINEKQLYILKKLSPNLILALDADAAGEEATARCVPFENLLEKEIRVVVAPAGQDPDDVIKADAEVWRRLLVSATPIVDFVFGRAAEPLNLRTARGKADLAAKLLPVVAEITDPVRRGHYLSLLAGRIGTTTADLQYSLAQLKLPQSSTKASTAAAAVPQGPANQLEDYFLAILVLLSEISARSFWTVSKIGKSSTSVSCAMTRCCSKKNSIPRCGTVSNQSPPPLSPTIASPSAWQNAPGDWRKNTLNPPPPKSGKY